MSACSARLATAKRVLFNTKTSLRHFRKSTDRETNRYLRVKPNKNAVRVGLSFTGLIVVLFFIDKIVYIDYLKRFVCIVIG